MRTSNVLPKDIVAFEHCGNQALRVLVDDDNLPSTRSLYRSNGIEETYMSSLTSYCLILLRGGRLTISNGIYQACGCHSNRDKPTEAQGVVLRYKMVERRHGIQGGGWAGGV